MASLFFHAATVAVCAAPHAPPSPLTAAYVLLCAAALCSRLWLTSYLLSLRTVTCAAEGLLGPDWGGVDPTLSSLPASAELHAAIARMQRGTVVTILEEGGDDSARTAWLQLSDDGSTLRWGWGCQLELERLTAMRVANADAEASSIRNSSEEVAKLPSMRNSSSSSWRRSSVRRNMRDSTHFDELPRRSCSIGGCFGGASTDSASLERRGSAFTSEASSEPTASSSTAPLRLPAVAVVVEPATADDDGAGGAGGRALVVAASRVDDTHDAMRGAMHGASSSSSASADALRPSLRSGAGAGAAAVPAAAPAMAVAVAVAARRLLSTSCGC